MVGGVEAVHSGCVPIRTCIGCRQRAAKTDLLRLVVRADDDGRSARVVPDPRGRMPGRGAYLHPDPACLEQALRRRSLPRALRVSGPVETSGVRRYLEGEEYGPDPSGPTTGCQ
ncbi:protein of unknown function DUF448 [Acidothermus cellulolyticus 11B]|uniref:YlxR domain-containing protein n=1 Tax=Acidothermus cellulolyticus (strain ATCC 43068 / DSM 8971 / 11B) TaxID=351607 RepID=A0LV28_ACIC1|nr:protein of unknown function DUF448 [Acidothermus cellulolyticus 11B]